MIINNQVGFTTAPASSRSSVYCTDVGADDPGADLPRERRRPRGVRARRAARVRVPDGVRQGRRHRHGLLPPPRSQRGRRPLDDAAAHVQPDRGEAQRPQAVHRGAHRPRRHHGRGGRERAAGLPGAARARLRGDAARPPSCRCGPRDVTAGLDLPIAQQATRDDDGPRDTAVDARGAEADRRRLRHAAAGLHRAPEAAVSCWSGARRWPARAASTGASASCSRSAPCCSRVARCAWPARTAAAARSCSGTRCSPTGSPAPSGRRCRTSPRTRRKFCIYDSLLSEFAAMGFEYGYSVERPDALVLLGGAVRRLRQRRADDRRRVHLELGAEVGPALLASSCCSRTATRARGPTTPPAGSSATCSCAPRTT